MLDVNSFCNKEPELVYKFRQTYACNDFRTQFRKIVLRNIKIGYNINVMRQTACKAVNPITVNTSLVACLRVGPQTITTPS